MMLLILTAFSSGRCLVPLESVVLVPVICGALVIVVVDGIARGDAIWRLAFSMIMIVTALQLGYFLGNVIRFVMAPAPIRAELHCRLRPGHLVGRRRIDSLPPMQSSRPWSEELPAPKCSPT